MRIGAKILGRRHEWAGGMPIRTLMDRLLCGVGIHTYFAIGIEGDDPVHVCFCGHRCARLDGLGLHRRVTVYHKG